MGILTQLIGSIFMHLLIFGFYGILFTAFSDYLPSKSVYGKFLIMYVILYLLSSPFWFVSKQIHGNSIFAYFLLEASMSLIIDPVVYALFYMFVARNFTMMYQGKKGPFFIITLLLFGLLFFTFVNLILADFAAINLSGKEELNKIEVEKQIFFLVNQQRQQFGLKPFQWDERLSTAARKHSSFLLESGGFSHTGFIGDRVDDRLKALGLFYLAAGENLYYGPQTLNLANETVREWLGSPGHRSLILDRDQLYSHGGVGVACKNHQCITTLDVAAFSVDINEIISPFDYAGYALNSPSFNLPGEYSVKINVVADESVNVLTFRSRKKLQDYLDEESPTKSGRRGKNVTITSTASQESFLAVYNNNDRYVRINVHLIYN